MSEIFGELRLDRRQDKHPLLQKRLHFRVALEVDGQQIDGSVQLPSLKARLVVLMYKEHYLATLQGDALLRVLKSVTGKGVGKEASLNAGYCARKLEVQARVALGAAKSPSETLGCSHLQIQSKVL